VIRTTATDAADGVTTDGCRTGTRASSRDRGAVDVSIEMLFGGITVLMALLLVFETTAYWHARNVFDDAASDGVRVAAAYDGTCADGIEAARAALQRQAGSWARDVQITCTDDATVTVAIIGRTPGVVGDALGMRASVAETAPRER
jgi:hypothetical protein